MVGIQMGSVSRRWNEKRYQNNRFRLHLSRSISLYDRPIEILSSPLDILLALEIYSVLLLLCEHALLHFSLLPSCKKGLA